MAMALKALVGGLGAAKRPTFEDFAEFVTESEKLRGIADEFNAATAKLDAAKNGSTRDKATRAGAKARVSALLKGQAAPVATIQKPDIEQLEFDVSVLREALFLQHEIVTRVTEECAAKIWDAIRPEHRAIQADILQKLVALSEALDREHDFIVRCGHDRLNPTGLLTIPHSIKNAVGSLRLWGSGVNAAGRTISEYAGRGAWDSSRIVS